MSGPKVVDIRAVRANQQRQWKKIRHRIEQEHRYLLTIVKTDDNASTSRSVTLIEQSIVALDLEHQNSPLPGLLDNVLDQAAAHLEFALQLKGELHQARLDRIAAEHARLRSMRIAVEGTVRRLQAANLIETSELLLCDPSEINLQAALEVLAKVKEQESNNALQSVADQISGSTTMLTFDQWLLSQGADEDPAIVRLERLAASVSSMDGLHNGSVWLNQIATAAQIADPSMRRLTTDSIAIRLSEERQRLLRQRERMQLLDELEAELAAYDDSADVLRKRIAQAGSSDTESIVALKNEVRQWCEDESKRRDQSESREAILTVLRSLGYEVHDSMATAWAENGQLIVKDSSRNDYGVELSTLQGDRLRTQLVRFGDQSESTERQRQRDIEVETQWCESHSKVMQELKNNGLQAEILAAREIGSTPVKIIAKPAQSQSNAVLESKPMQRQQKPT